MKANRVNNISIQYMLTIFIILLFSLLSCENASDDIVKTSQTSGGGCTRDTVGYPYDEFAGSVINGTEVIYREIMDKDPIMISWKEHFSEYFMPFESVFPFVSASDAGVLANPFNGSYYYFYPNDETECIECIQFTAVNLKSSGPLGVFFHQDYEKSSSFSRERLEEKNVCYVEGFSNSVPFIKVYRLYDPTGKSGTLNEFHNLLLICNNYIFRIDVFNDYIDKYDIFSDEYIDRVTSYIRDNIAPKNGGLKEYDPEKSFLEIYEEATAK